ncbi:MAG: hypothetical protein V5A44_00405 [Haloarculaceae archaeon]
MPRDDRAAACGRSGETLQQSVSAPALNDAGEFVGLEAHERKDHLVGRVGRRGGVEVLDGTEVGELAARDDALPAVAGVGGDDERRPVGRVDVLAFRTPRTVPEPEVEVLR